MRKVVDDILAIVKRPCHFPTHFCPVTADFFATSHALLIMLALTFFATDSFQLILR